MPDSLSFERLLQPLGGERFVEDYWQQRPLVLQPGDPNRYQGLLSTSDVEAIVRFGQLQSSQLKFACASPDTSEHHGGYVSEHLTGDTNALLHSYHQGESVVLNHLQGYWEPAARLCAAVGNFLQFGVGVNAYLTPRGAQGFPPHFDTHDAFVLQLCGTKLWRLYQPARELPSEGEDNRPIPREALGNPTREVQLGVGDLLYLPRGHVHEARTTDESSLHVTVAVRPLQWSDLLAELLRLATEQQVDLRRALPMHALDDDTGPELLAGELSSRLQAFAASVAEREAVEAAVGGLRRRLIRRMRPLADGQLAALDRLERVGADSLVQKRAGMLCHVARRERDVEIEFPGNRMSGPLSIEPALSFIARSSEAFSVADLPGSLSIESKLVLVKRAVREGLLTVVSAGAAPDDPAPHQNE